LKFSFGLATKVRAKTMKYVKWKPKTWGIRDIHPNEGEDAWESKKKHFQDL
jgi:hypothetical protein